MPPGSGQLALARKLAAAGQDEAAKHAYIALLRAAPDNGSALVELAALALAGGHVSAARTAYEQALACNPRHAIARIGLAALFRTAGGLEAARGHYLAALSIPDLPAPLRAAAHQGLAWTFEALGDDAAAAAHRRLGFTGNAVISRRYRGAGPAVPLLLLVSARDGNFPVQGWIDERHFAVTAIYTEFFDPAQRLPPHALLVNAIGDAELCGPALDAAEAIIARTAVPVINPPGRVRQTSRANNAARLRALPGVIAPRIRRLRQADPLDPDALEFPVLLRAPGFHTGRHFVRVETAPALAGAIGGMPPGEVLAIQYLDARGQDGMARKYRVMFVDGIAYPLHLAISPDWKVHYFSAAMADNPAHRAEEQAFLTDMPAVLGPRAITALAAIDRMLGLDYAGIDFGLDASGRLLHFEANATMAIVPPGADPIWDYRRPAISRVLGARAEMLRRRIGSTPAQGLPSGDAQV